MGKVCLQRRCIATEGTRLAIAYSLPREYVYSDIAIPAFGRHVTICPCVYNTYKLGILIKN
jgi:hypothetical protein